MSLRLQLRTPQTIPIYVSGVLPESVRDLALTQIGELPIRQGNQMYSLNQLFEISGRSENDTMIWQGDLSAVHWLGHAMTTGTIIVEGHVGRHLGSSMSGGNIHVAGNTSDYTGCEMTGGRIEVDGAAGDWLGAAYPGSPSGTSGGEIVVLGDAGHAAGFALRRGTIAIAGHCGKLAGWNMRAGTLLVGKQVGALAGKGMKRGTLILPSSKSSQHNTHQLPPTFTASGLSKPVFTSILSRRLANHSDAFQLNEKSFRLFLGDHLKGGRGEVLICD